MRCAGLADLAEQDRRAFYKVRLTLLLWFTEA